jgi:uncharacterized coiled-coil DUF342 family protein
MASKLTVTDEGTAMTKTEIEALKRLLNLLAETCLDNQRKIAALSGDSAAESRVAENEKAFSKARQALEKALSGRP